MLGEKRDTLVAPFVRLSQREFGLLDLSGEPLDGLGGDESLGIVLATVSERSARRERLEPFALSVERVLKVGARVSQCVDVGARIMRGGVGDAPEVRNLEVQTREAVVKGAAINAVIDRELLSVADAKRRGE